jgi:RNA polymerase sigma-70 factor (ECF subfamily)
VHAAKLEARSGDESLAVRDDLVARARAGDREAFEGLYRENLGRVYALSLRMTGDPTVAEERVQDVFVLAWRKLRSFRGESAFSTWLHRLAVNVLLGEERASRRREARERVAAEASPGATSATGGLAVDLERAIAELPEGARQVFVLYAIEGYGHKEIAEMVGIAEGTSKAQLHHARAQLKRRLER